MQAECPAVVPCAVPGRGLAGQDVLARLDSGLRDGRLLPWFQPVVDASSGTVVSVEACLRLADPELGLLSPTVFLGIARASGLMPRITEASVAGACAAYAASAARGLVPGTVTINLCRDELVAPGMVGVVTSELGKAAIGPGRFAVEISPAIAGAPADDPAKAALRALAEIGVGLVIDDFGGNPFDPGALAGAGALAVKIDRMVVALLGRNAGAEQEIARIAREARLLGLMPIAKGVETPEDARTLARLGCAAVQGYAIARPMPADAMGRWLEARGLDARSRSHAA